jgi:acetoin utilization protein AcuB
MKDLSEIRVEDIMTRKVATVEMDDSLSLVKRIFDQARFHHLLVTRNDELVGVISDRDLLKSVSPYIGTVSETTRDLASLNKKVHQIMSRYPVSLLLSATLADAVELFNTHRVSCIPVVNVYNHPVGIVSWRDVLRSLENC